MLVVLILVSNSAYSEKFSPELFTGTSWKKFNFKCGTVKSDILHNRAESITYSSDCIVNSGIWNDNYNDKKIYVPSDVVIDHVIPLEYYFSRSRERQNIQRRIQYANDVSNIVTTTAIPVLIKGSKGPSEWMPANTKYHCNYLKTWRDIANKYYVILLPADKKFIDMNIVKCRL